MNSEKKICLILTMAGIYSRFKNFSGQVPKFLLPISNRPILHYIIKEFAKSNSISEVFLIANKRDIAFKSQVIDIVKEFYFDNFFLEFIDDTSGQLETAFIASEIINNKNDHDTPILIHNIDTILLNRNFSEVKSKLKYNDCYIDIFHSDSNNYSYILKESGCITKICEKKVVSNLASSGCYGFANSNQFAEFSRVALNRNKKYISDVINIMIKCKKNIATSALNFDNTVVIGTPNEYLDFLKNPVNLTEG